ncbi:enoyl-CoA hydratase/isomerase family protein [Microcella daejeonensis]|uniref:enoyl-CoA hydratase/isomerase family protein n=1 Tax=Microcella daejeonensis TaxID=2994971 RepID=UPI00226F9295|nr:enoyl-CoA hydratase/isomerase family protein [Microcella daejeonensis]WAB84743.1 enoyl-CoA hydratase/isomerase family protein [Microcella daejeonensis]
MSEPELIVERRGALGLLTLNRPRALNALTHGMVLEIRAALDAWAVDGAVRTVAIRGAGDRAFCAGGDIVGLHRDATSGDGRAAAVFWRDEYRLNAAIARYPKPIVALMHGIVLGGGVGLSAHASHRVVTDSTRIGMPETGIGFIPDVGGTWLLSRAPGELGTHLALTAGSVGAGDALALGLADAFLEAERLDALVSALESERADSAIARLSGPAPSAPLLAEQHWIDAAYVGDDPLAVLARLDAAPEPAAHEAAASIRAKSPTSVGVTLAALRAARGMPDLEHALAAEFRLALRALLSPDFAEGVRAQVIDKDRAPHWSPPTLQSLDPAAAHAAAAPLTPAERERFAVDEWTAA